MERNEIKNIRQRKFFHSNNKLVFILISILIGFLVGAVVLALAGYNPIEAYKSLFQGVFRKPRNVGWMIVNATPIIFTGLGVAFAFKTGLFNIGAEGQYMIGSIVGFVLGYLLHLPLILHVLVILVAAALAGAIYGGLAGFIKAKFGMHEVITTIMLNWIAFYFTNFIVNRPLFKMPNSMGTYEIQESARITFPKLSENAPEFLRSFFGASVHFGIILAIIVAIVLYYILEKTTLGYQLKAVGLNDEAAKYGGINTNAKLTQSMAISGAVCALGGACQVMGYTYGIYFLSSMENFGFDGLAVSLLANNNPFGCIFTGMFFGGLNYGGSNIQRVLQVPTELINIIMGTIIIFTAIPLVFKIIRAKVRKKRGA
ncbi:MAG: ABC transporter permease [Tissierellia bacterium]|nr:ABC transporter permease [Tissierellia bacterium]